MAFIDVVEWRTNNNDIYAYKYPHQNLSTATQLIVRESQEACLFTNGQLMGKFGPGRHTLDTANLPLLRNFFGIPFGGKNPFTAEVWFVNKAVSLNIDWVSSQMRFFDQDYDAQLPLIARGRYGLTVKEPEKFLIKLVGTRTEYRAHDLTDQFQGELITKVNSCILSYMNTNLIGINRIGSYLEDLSRFIKNPMKEFWDAYGFELISFVVTEVNLNTDTSEGREIAKAMAERSSQKIAGYTYQEKQLLEAAKNGSDIGIIGAGVLTGLFGGFGGRNPSVQQPSYPNNVPQQNPGYAVPSVWFCADCGYQHPVTAQFCGNCGHRYNPCPACGTDNPEHASRCVKCGTYFAANGSVGSYCWKCNSPIKPGKKFCESCGAKQ